MYATTPDPVNDPHTARIHAILYLRCSYSTATCGPALPLSGCVNTMVAGCQYPPGGLGATIGVQGPICFGDGSACSFTYTTRQVFWDPARDMVGHEVIDPSDGQPGLRHTYSGAGPWQYSFGTTCCYAIYGPAAYSTPASRDFHYNNPDRNVRLEGLVTRPSAAPSPSRRPPAPPRGPASPPPPRPATVSGTSLDRAPLREAHAARLPRRPRSAGQTGIGCPDRGQGPRPSRTTPTTRPPCSSWAVARTVHPWHGSSRSRRRRRRPPFRSAPRPPLAPFRLARPRRWPARLAQSALRPTAACLRRPRRLRRPARRRPTTSSPTPGPWAPCRTRTPQARAARPRSPANRRLAAPSGRRSGTSGRRPATATPPSIRLRHRCRGVHGIQPGQPHERRLQRRCRRDAGVRDHVHLHRGDDLLYPGRRVRRLRGQPCPERRRLRGATSSPTTSSSGEW